MQDALQNRKHAFLLEARAITADEEASPVTLKLQSMHGAWPSKICCSSASSPLQCPRTCEQHPENEKQTQSNKEDQSYLG